MTRHAWFLGLALTAIVNVSTLGMAADIDWDGSEGDDFWTNGTQDNSSGVFPRNGTSGANWTIDDGATITSGQIVTPDGGDVGSNNIDYTYSDHDWVIDGATIRQSAQVKLSGGTLTITDSDISLLPSSQDTTANLAGLNIGQTSATIATITGSMIATWRSNQNGDSFRVLNGSSLTIEGSTINAEAETNESGTFLGTFDVRHDNTLVIAQDGSTINTTRDISLRNDSEMTIDKSRANITRDLALRDTAEMTILDSSTIDVGSRLDLQDSATVIVVGGSFVTVEGDGVDDVDLQDSGNSLTILDGTLIAPSLRTDGNSSVSFDTGTITLSDSNPLRSNNAFNGTDFSWIGEAGKGTLRHTNLSVNNSNLAANVAQGYFSIDGIQIDPTIDHTSDWSNVGNIVALNTELSTMIVGGNIFEITVDGTEQQLNLAFISLPGDFNLDDIVDAADFTVWRDNLGGDASALNGNGSGSATVVADDYALWNTHFGDTAGAGSSLATVVPEPGSLILASGVSLISLATRRVSGR